MKVQCSCGEIFDWGIENAEVIQVPLSPGIQVSIRHVLQTPGHKIGRLEAED